MKSICEATRGLPDKILAPYRSPKTAMVTMQLFGEEMRFAGSGALALPADCGPERAVFEIGSITKIFTALLLSLLVEEGKIDPNRPINKVSNALSHLPDWITPRSLATHTSGLPRIHVPLWKLPFSPLPEDPYGTFSRSDLLRWFKTSAMTRPPRRPKHLYSNLGYGLLGEVLAMSENQSYTELLAEKVILPLGLTDTAATLTQSQQARFMQPYNTAGKPVVPWTFQAMAGAGCLRASARDLGLFSCALIKALAHPTTPLDRAICQSTAPVFGLGPRGANEPVAQCMGWLSIKLDKNAPKMLFHNGGTAGSTCALYICPDANSAISILSNQGIAASFWSRTKLQWSNPDHAMSELFSKQI